MDKNTVKKQILQIVAASIIATFVILWQMRILDFDLNVLPGTSGDGLLGIMTLRSMKESGLRGLWINSRLGAPDVSALVDCPFLDLPMAVLGYIFTVIFRSEITAFYLLYIITYPLAAASMCFLMSKLTDRAWMNILISVLYAITPYHFWRGMGHLTLSFYYVIPLGIYCAMIVASENYTGLLPQKWKDSAGIKVCWLLLIFLIGISNVYYSFFCMIMVLMSIIYKLVIKKTWKVMIYEASVFYEMAAAFLAGILPKVIFSLKYGKNTVACVRLPWESELYGLKIIQLFVPTSLTKSDFLRNIFTEYTENGFNINENMAASMGSVGCVGFVLMCVWVIQKLMLENKRRTREDAIVTFCSLNTLVLVLYCTTGGFGTIFSYLVTPEIRALNRVSIVIEALAMMALSVFLVSHCKKIFSIIFMVILSLYTFYADIPPIRALGTQDVVKDCSNVYSAFFSEIEEQLEEDSMVYQLPMAEFPEYGYVYNMADYSMLRGYLFTDTIRWSYGGVKGRNDAAKGLYVDNGMSKTFVEELLNNGFSGVYIDTEGYEDGGAAINGFYQKQLGIKPLVSEDGKLYFYNLTDKIDF